MSFSLFALVYVISVLFWLMFLRIAGSTSWRVIFLLALAVRLPLLFEPPHLSGDAYRYLWDGQVLAAGRNPYAAPPDAPDLAALRKPWHASINHPEIATIYPPFAQALFLLNAWIGGSLLGWRFLMLLADLATLILLRRLLQPRALAAWAACPFVAIEGIWSGHLEAVATTALVGAFVLLTSKSESLAATWLGVAAGLKLTPLFALPAMLTGARNRVRLAVVFVVVLAIPLMITAAMGPLMPGFRDYATRWIFNAPAYDIIRGVFEWGDLAGLTKSLWTSVKDPLHLEPIAPWVYAHLHTDMLVRATLAFILLITLLAIARSRVTVSAKIASSLGALFLCSPAVHPWYWLLVVPFALANGTPSATWWGSRGKGLWPLAWWIRKDESDSDNHANSPGFKPGRLDHELHLDLWLWMALCAPASYLLYDGVAKEIVWSLCYGLPLLFVFTTRLRSSLVERNMQSP